MISTSELNFWKLRVVKSGECETEVIVRKFSTTTFRKSRIVSLKLAFSKFDHKINFKSVKEF